ncbi:hypothetical protein Z043_121240, partial [Scleropages formosus]
KECHVLLLENQKLFKEFVDHCSAHTKEHPEVITYLQSKHAKASPTFLSSVELRNTLGRCLTQAQAYSSKTFVYINELCTVLKQHAVKKRISATTVASSAGEGLGMESNAENPSTSIQEEHKKPTKASRRQIAYLENLLKVYYEEIRRLQEKEISLDDMMEEDSSYIQEHRLKRKMMKIYNKLCELKDCSTLTGRVIEQKVHYSGTRYPEINRKIERFINSPESQQNPPDYTDILQVVQRANERYSLCLSRKQVAEIAQDVFRETGNRLQERRHLDMIYNFGSYLTDAYKPAADPALSDSALSRKLRSNRDIAIANLNSVITKYALKQEDGEENERRKRVAKGKVKEEVRPGSSGRTEETEGCESERDEPESEGDGQDGSEDDDEEDEDVSSDPDIEEELEASRSQEGADDEIEEEEEEEEEEDVANESDKEHHWGTGQSSSPDVEVIGGRKPGSFPFSDECGFCASVACVGFFQSRKKKRPSESSTEVAFNGSHKHEYCVSVRIWCTAVLSLCLPLYHSDDDIPLDMGVYSGSSPLQADSTHLDSPTQELVSSSRCTPPPKKNK